MLMNAKVQVFVRVMLVVAVSVSMQLVGSRIASQDTQEIDTSVRRPEWGSKLREYYRMKDPKAAAKLMLEDAAALGIDADRNPRPYQWRPGAILVPSGGFTPPEGERSFVDSVAALLSRGVAQGDTVCLLQFERSVSLREIASMMSMGVRFLRQPSDPNIVKLPLTLVQAVYELPYVRWMGPYLPSYKYKHHSQYDSDHVFTVDTFEGDEEMIRRNVASIGGAVTDYSADFIEVRMPASQISALARFWWVEEIYQYFVNFDGLLPPPAIPDQAPAQGFINPFHAQDSRRLVSKSAQSSWRGQGEVVGILDNGCWDHTDLHDAQDSRRSDPWTQKLHGTLVAGIIAGAHTELGPDWISGIAGKDAMGASGATFLFRDHAIKTPQKAVEYFSQQLPAVQISNHSYNVVWRDSTGVPDSLAYDATAKYFDQMSDQSDLLLVASAGNLSRGFITSPGTGKNVLTVGAVCYEPLSTSVGEDTIGALARYSSVGPTRDDGRLKPDLVAPGGGPGEGWGSGSGLEGGVVSCDDDRSYPCDWLLPDGAQTDYTRASGTSFAAPFVTGAAAVLASWYKNTRAPTDPTLSSELLKAMLVNTAIPVTGNGEDPSSPYAYQDTTRAFANTKYGYGLLNVYTGVASPTNEYRRVLVAEGQIDKGWAPVYKYFHVPSGRDAYGNLITPKYLVATMVYDDFVMPTHQRGNALTDSLTFTLSGWGGDYTFNIPPNCRTGSTIQKIIVPRPDTVMSWCAQVEFVDSKNPNPPAQRYVIVADVMYGVPDLQVDVSLVTPAESIRVNHTFEVKVKVTNVGMNVAAGVTARVTGAGLWNLEDKDTWFYLDNLDKNGASAERVFRVEPSQTGNIELVAEVNAINKLLPPSDYPVTQSLSVPVASFDIIDGYVRTDSTESKWLQGVENVEMQVQYGTSVRTNQNGYYRIKVNSSWSGKITPHREGALFDPPYLTYGNLPEDTTDHYALVVRTLAGQIVDPDNPPGHQAVEGIKVICEPPEGDTLLYSDGNTCSLGITDKAGEYRLFVEHRWRGKVRPTPGEGYVIFDPPYRDVDSVVIDRVVPLFRTRRATEWTENGLPVSIAASEKTNPDLADDGQGGAIFVWEDDRNGLDKDIYAARLGYQGNSVWPSDVAVCAAESLQAFPRAIDVANGEVVVVWRDRRNGTDQVYAQKTDRDGQTLWDANGVAVCSDGGSQVEFDVVSDGLGGVFVVWAHSQSGGDYNIRAQRIDQWGEAAWGTGGVVVCDGANDQRLPVLARDSQDGIYVAWEDARAGVEPDYHDVYAMRVFADGTSAWPPDANGVLVTNLTFYNGAPAYQGKPRIIADGNGGAIVTCEGNGPYGNDPYCVAQKISSVGDLQWGEGGVRLGCGGYFRIGLGYGIASDGEWGVIIAWPRHSYFYPNSYYDHVYVQGIRSGGTYRWSSAIHATPARSSSWTQGELVPRARIVAAAS